VVQQEKCRRRAIYYYAATGSDEPVIVGHHRVPFMVSDEPTKRREQEKRGASTPTQSREENFQFATGLGSTNLPQTEEIEWIACKMVKLIRDRRRP
jgi:hypothetical protein